MKQPDEIRQSANPRWYASAIAAAYIYYWVFHFLLREWAFNLPYDPREWVRGAHWTNATLAAILAAALVMLRGGRLDRTNSRTRQWILIPVLLVFCGINAQIFYLDQKEAWVFMEDVGRTTITADHLILRGINPYAARVDAAGASMIRQSAFGGYKYLPVMMAAYLPFDLIFNDGDRAILVGNLIFSIIGALLLGLCVRKWISLDAALLSVLLLLMPEILYHEQYGHGCNDMIPMLALLGAVYFLDRRFICGLLVGLSISCKLLPGGLWIAVCLTPRMQRRYFAGIGAGLLPCLPFFLWNPPAFIRNIFVFILIRPVEDNSAMYGLPPLFRPVLSVIFLAIFLAIAWRTARKEVSPIQRCGMAAVLGLSVLLLAPLNHPNYFLWWVIPLCVSITAAIFNPVLYEWMNRGPRLAVK